MRAIPSAADDVEIVLGELGSVPSCSARWRSCWARPDRPGRPGAGDQDSRDSGTNP